MNNREQPQCQGKLRYRDELSAKIALAKQGRAGRLGSQDLMRIYRCELCGAWHMGHSPSGRPAGRIAAISHSEPSRRTSTPPAENSRRTPRL